MNQSSQATMQKYTVLGLMLILNACTLHKSPTHNELNTIAFGSCNRQDHEQPFWNIIAAQNPDLWIWLGDNIYADTDNMSLMAQKYQQQKDNPHYRKFINAVPVTGTWDDHDYGMNDGNRTFHKKTEAKNNFIDFLDIPNSDPVHQYPGIYRSHDYGQNPKQVKIILLDTRTFQSPLERTPKGSKRNYISQPKGALLGEQQWQWLSKELNQSKANINIIASSIQVIAEDHRYEMWANFPNERKRLLNLIVSSKAQNPIILSGDRHLSEISQINWQGQKIVDITASGMTHAFTGAQEYNQHRTGNLITVESFSTMQIDWNKQQIELLQFDMSGELLNRHDLGFK